MQMRVALVKMRKKGQRKETAGSGIEQTDSPICGEGGAGVAEGSSVFQAVALG